jgi:hypothetical protein
MLPPRRSFLAFAASVALAGTLHGADPIAQEGPESLPATPMMKEIEPGVFEIGKLRLDQKNLAVTFPAVLNMKEGLLEYLLVSPRGSTHESLLVSDVSPSDVHFAMLLLGAKGGGEKTEEPPAQIDAKYLKTAPKMKGDTVLITVKWKAGNEEKTVPVEDWLFDAKAKKEIEHGPWTYNGSMIVEGRFLALTEGTFVALVTNPSALINNPRKGNDNDQMWSVNANVIPPVNTPVEVTFKLVPPAEAKPDTQKESKPAKP